MFLFIYLFYLIEEMGQKCFSWVSEAFYTSVYVSKSSPSCFQVWDPGPTPGRGERPADPEGEGRLWQLQTPAL